MAINTSATRVPKGRELTFDDAGVRAAFPHTLEALNEYGQAVRDRYREKLTANNRPTRRDTLRSTAEYIVDVNGMTFAVSLDLASYWKYVEENTRPHWPPRDAIVDWIMVKPVIPSGGGTRVPTVESLAFLIGRKISRDGTIGTHDLEHATAELSASWEMRIDYAINFDLAENFDLIIQNYLNK